MWLVFVEADMCCRSKIICTFCIELLAKVVGSHCRRQMINSQAQ